MARVVLGLGSNLGERHRHLERARVELEGRGLIIISAASPIIESSPLGPPQPLYLNQVIIGETRLAPRSLLVELKQIERDLGRRPGPRWGPRPIDLDILDFAGRQSKLADLTLPHPGICEREFVLLPWSLVAPLDPVPGTGRTVEELLAELRNRSGS